MAITVNAEAKTIEINEKIQLRNWDGEPSKSSPDGKNNKLHYEQFTLIGYTPDGRKIKRSTTIIVEKPNFVEKPA